VKKYGHLLVIGFCLVCSDLSASANTFIRETERLVSYSNNTYTVMATQYEQTYSYLTGINRLYVRVIDRSTNELLSETLLGSTQVSRAPEKPFTATYTPLPDEAQSMQNILLEPQILFDNRQQPTYPFHVDEHGVFLEKNGRHDVLALSTVESRFSAAGSGIDRKLDSRFDLAQALATDNLEFTGWYKVKGEDTQHYFIVLKLGRFDDDTGGLEYVFSIPK